MDKKTEPGADELAGVSATASADLIMRNPQYGLDIAAMLAKVPPLQQTYYAVMLSSQQTGWTPETRNRYFKWFRNAFGYQGGRSYVGFLDKARQLALTHVPADQQERYKTLSGQELLTASGRDLATSYSPKGPGRRWEVDTALAVIDRGQGLAARNFDTGKQIFSAVLCNRCHTMRGEGSDAGPDLTQLGNRFSKKDILEAIILPNKAISDQYAATIFNLKNGESVLGRIASEDKSSYSIIQNPFLPEELRKIPKKDVLNRSTSTVSIMLPGLINSLNGEELKDLMAYLLSGGNPQNPVYTEGRE